MKISAMPAGAGGTPGVDLTSTHIGTTASSERLAAAKALAQGLKPEERRERDVSEDRTSQSVRRITMRTNASPERYAQAAVETPAEEISTALDAGGQTNAAAESTQPLSPQFAALAKQRRALQVKERELADREAKFSQTPEKSGDYVSKADLLANPLTIFDLGVTHDQLTEAILSNASGVTPEIKALKEELKRVKEDMTKTFSDRDTQAEQQVLAEMQREAQAKIQTGDDYEMIRETRSLPHVIDLIKRTYKASGEVLSVEEALNLVETDLLTENVKIANLKKVKSQMVPEPVQPPQSQGRQMKTLTNRDSATIPMDRKARAMAAFSGTLRK